MNEARDLVVVEAQPAMRDDQARLNITFGGFNGDLADPIGAELTDGDVKQIAAEALAAGSVIGVPAHSGADLRDFVVERFAPTEGFAYTRILLRPKTPFGVPAP